MEGFSGEEIRKIVPSEDYFRKIISEEFKWLKFPKITRLTKCKTCVLLR